MATEIYQIKESEDTILIVNENEGTVVFIATERNGIDGADGADGDGGVTYTATLGDVTTVTISSATHEVPNVRNITVFDPDGDTVFLSFRLVDNNVSIESNISLLNHTIKIF